jgi:hypothetical protein
MKSAISAALVSMRANAQTDEIGFVFEMVRHGARTSMGGYAMNHDCFTVPDDMLTQQGMRQRQLLGAYNRQKYTE